MKYNNLKLTDNIKNIKQIYSIINNKKYYEIVKNNILIQILCDEYQFLTCSLYSLFFRPHVPNYTLSFNLEDKYKDVLIVKNNNVYINDYIFYPVGKYYKFGINSAFYYYYLTIINDFPKNSDIVIVQVIGPWEIYNNELHLFFELENILEKTNNCKVKTIFLLIKYGLNITYEKIIIDNSENLEKNYIIIDCDNHNNFNNIKSFIGTTNNIFIDVINLYSTKSCHNEIATLPFKILLYNKLLECLNINGNLYINNKTFLFYKPTYQFLYKIYKKFDNFKILKNNIVFLHFGIFKFSNLKKKINNFMNKTINLYINIDPYLGQHFFPKDNYNSPYCTNLQNNSNISNTVILIKSIYKKKIPDKFINIFSKIHLKHQKLLSKYHKKITLITSIFNNSDINKRNNNINNILINNIYKSIEYCIVNNIEINDIYNNMNIPNKLSIIHKYFPKKKNINYNNLEIAIDSNFSVSNTNDMIRLSKLIISNNKFIKYIIDGNSNIGIGAIVFSDFFIKVFAIEYVYNTFTKLKTNIETYKQNNILIFNDDIIRFMNDTKILNSINYNINNCCIFLDPPWSGYFYKIEKNVDLYLNNINIIDLIIKMNIKYVYIKVPFNFNFIYLYKNFINITIYKFTQYFIIYIIK